MKHFFKTLIINASFLIINCNDYDKLFMRDIAFFLDNTENSYTLLNTTAIKSRTYNMAITDMVGEVLYYESSPMLVAKSTLQHLFELSSIVEQLIEPDPLKYKQNLQKFMIGRYSNTILQNSNLVNQLANQLRRIFTNYNVLQLETSQKIYILPIKTVQEELDQLPYGYLSVGLIPSPDINDIAIYLFKYFLTVQKIKSLNLEFFSIDNFLALVIPKSQLNKIRANMLEYLNQNNISPKNDELILGLKHKSLEKITNPFDPKSYFFQHQWATQKSLLENKLESIAYIQTNLIQTLNSLFFTYKEIAKIFSTSLKDIYEKYLWNIYIAGHGSNPSESFTIAAIPESNFIELLLYFNSQINTNIVFTVSCYGAGERLKLFNIPNLKYILALGSTTKSVTVRAVEYKFSLNQQKKLELLSRTNVSQFFESLRRYQDEAYLDLFNKIQFFWKLNKQKDKKFYNQNIPQIKLPNTDWFQIIDLQKNELNLNKLLIDLHNYNKKPIIVKNKRLLFLHQKYQYEEHPLISPETKLMLSSIKKETKKEIDINFPIIFQGTRMPVVISMEPSNVKYNFLSIEAADFGLSYIALKFMGLPTQMYNRTFNIKSLTIRNPYFSSVQYPGSFQDNVLFKNVLPKLLSASLATNQKTILLSNVTVKVRTTGVNLVFRLKFEYGGKKFVIENATYPEIVKILNKPKIPNLIEATKDMMANTIMLPLKPSKYQPKQAKKGKSFKEIEEALKKKILEGPRIQDTQEQRFILQVLSQTLSSLSNLSS